MPLYKEKLTFAYRIGYQGTIAGEAPFYVQQYMNTQYLSKNLSEGLGGNTSLRGIVRNRVVGDGVAWANFELRYRPFNFKLFGQRWYFGFNPFFDLGMVVQKYREDLMLASDNENIYNGDDESLHMSAGIGLKAVMNKNFVISAEVGKAFDKRDGNIGFSLGVNYIF